MEDIVISRIKLLVCMVSGALPWSLPAITHLGESHSGERHVRSDDDALRRAQQPPAFGPLLSAWELGFASKWGGLALAITCLLFSVRALADTRAADFVSAVGLFAVLPLMGIGVWLYFIGKNMLGEDH
jgi:hypothetical protein